jgi:ABC-2 type transport system permease protein
MSIGADFPAGPAPTSEPFSRFVQETRGQTVRWLIHLRREPFAVLFALVQPVILLVFFGGAFQKVGAQLSPEGNYRTFLLPGILTLTVFGNSMSGGIPLLFDKENGFLARLIAAPVSRSSILVSRFLTVNFVSTLQILVMLGMSELFGVRVATGIPGILLLIAIGLMLGLGLTVVSLVLAFRLTGHGDFFALLGIITLPVTFLSTAFVPYEAMPRWMQLLASLNPMTYAIDAMRSLVDLGVFRGGLVLRCVAALVIFDVVMMFLGVRYLRRQL